MPDDSDFIRSILADPEDRGPRLAYPNWLEEGGEHQDRVEGVRALILPRCPIGPAPGRFAAPGEPRRDHARRQPPPRGHHDLAPPGIRRPGPLLTLHSETPAMPADEPDIIRSILADPDDDGPRLAYSDWLEERG